MLADDDADDRDLFGEAISATHPNIHCYFAENGNELLETLSGLKEMPHIVFLDINMPVMDGWECLRLLRAEQRFAKVHVIMYSTSSMKQDVDRALKAGATCFLTKPGSFADLTLLLSLIIDHIDTDIRCVHAKLTGEQGRFFFCRR